MFPGNCLIWVQIEERSSKFYESYTETPTKIRPQKYRYAYITKLFDLKLTWTRQMNRYRATATLLWPQIKVTLSQMRFPEIICILEEALANEINHDILRAYTLFYAQFTLCRFGIATCPDFEIGVSRGLVCSSWGGLGIRRAGRDGTPTKYYM